jgi:hypothetical protein
MALFSFTSIELIVPFACLFPASFISCHLKKKKKE